MFILLLIIGAAIASFIFACQKSELAKGLEKELEEFHTLEEVHSASLQEIEDLLETKKHLEEVNASLEEANASIEEAASEAVRAIEEQRRLTIMASRLGTHPSFGETKLLLEAGFYEAKTEVLVSIDPQVGPQRMSVQNLLAALAVKEEKNDWLVDILMSA